MDDEAALGGLSLAVGKRAANGPSEGSLPRRRPSENPGNRDCRVTAVEARHAKG